MRSPDVFGLLSPETTGPSRRSARLETFKQVHTEWSDFTAPPPWCSPARVRRSFSLFLPSFLPFLSLPSFFYRVAILSNSIKRIVEYESYVAVIAENALAGVSGRYKYINIYHIMIEKYVILKWLSCVVDNTQRKKRKKKKYLFRRSGGEEHYCRWESRKEEHLHRLKKENFASVCTSSNTLQCSGT